MAPRSSNRPGKMPRRNPAPLLPGRLFLFCLLFVALAAVWLFPFTSSPSIRYDEFERLLDGKLLKKVTLVGNDRLYGEVRDEVKAASDEILKKMKIPNGTFSVKLLPSTDREKFYARVRA